MRNVGLPATGFNETFFQPPIASVMQDHRVRAIEKLLRRYLEIGRCRVKHGEIQSGRRKRMTLLDSRMAFSAEASSLRTRGIASASIP